MILVVITAPVVSNEVNEFVFGSNTDTAADGCPAAGEQCAPGFWALHP